MELDSIENIMTNTTEGSTDVSEISKNSIIHNAPNHANDDNPSTHETIAANAKLDSFARPPKPVPFGQRERSSSVSRDELRQVLQQHKRRSTLTPAESQFLEELVVHGNEIEVSLATQKLCDETLFFPEEEEEEEEERGGLDATALEGLNLTIRGNSNDLSSSLNSIHSTASAPAAGSVVPLRRSQGSNTSSQNGLSDKSQEHLQKRRNSSLYGQIWKAHESGLKVSKRGSVQSVNTRKPSLVRRSKSEIYVRRSSSVLSTTTQDLVANGGPTQRPGEDAIFRPDRPGEEDIFRHGSTRATVLPPTTRPGRAKSWSKMERPSKGIRRTSEGSRKSVSFKKDHELEEYQDRLVHDGMGGIPLRIAADDRRFSIDEVSEIDMEALEQPLWSSGTSSNGGSSNNVNRLPPIRADSVSSVPSLNLHRSHPIRSDSMSSVPSLHHGHPVGDVLRSDSISSIPSLHHGHPLNDPLRSSDSTSSIPSLHHGHALDKRPLRTDSQYSDASGWMTESSGWMTDSGSLFPEDSPSHSNREASASTLGSSDIQTNGKEGAAWAAPRPTTKEQRKPQLLRHPSQDPTPRPVLLRRASRNVYHGEGIEVSELVPGGEDEEAAMETLSAARKFDSMVSMGESTTATTTSSFDEGVLSSSHRADEIFRELRQALSDEQLSSVQLGTAESLLRGSSASDRNKQEEQDPSWDMHTDEDEDDEDERGHYDAWNVLEREASDGYGGEGTLPFLILGTSGDDVSSTPHVLSPPLMESLQNFLPYSLTEDNFWMKYSLLRDGASMHTMLQQIRGAKYTIIALETWDGEVFGSFTSEPWRKNWNYFGTGEAFLWRMRQSRKTFCTSIIDQAHMESELDVFPWTGENFCVQLCTSEKIAVGGGTTSAEKKVDDPVKQDDYGFGLTLDSQLMRGTSTHCATFGSPPLSKEHADGSPFEIVNMEVWTWTPCITLEEAEKLELGKLFLHTESR